jgi:hypothetical protein
MSYSSVPPPDVLKGGRSSSSSSNQTYGKEDQDEKVLEYNKLTKGYRAGRDDSPDEEE